MDDSEQTQKAASVDGKDLIDIAERNLLHSIMLEHLTNNAAISELIFNIITKSMLSGPFFLNPSATSASCSSSLSRRLEPLCHTAAPASDHVPFPSDHSTHTHTPYRHSTQSNSCVRLLPRTSGAQLSLINMGGESVLRAREGEGDGERLQVRRREEPDSQGRPRGGIILVPKSS
ncbi:hypothetical protein EW146_g7861 [Bondarzewia mesenterica]|uniref:Uncharacterized protein n=1 Tax=Bondarzewia mesenterica TaxID=1095465 RepID=A0A4S4LKQ8_9AGAM|nr:hypothetical protein EW146_g7861 [Bondarzewia mesenterica]